MEFRLKSQQKKMVPHWTGWCVSQAGEPQSFTLPSTSHQWIPKDKSSEHCKKKPQKTSSSVHPCPTDVWTVKGVQKEDPVPILLLCSSITHLWPLLETNHCSRSVNDKSCFSPPTFSTSLQVVRLFYSFLFYSRLSVLSIRENYQNYAGKAYPKSPARAAGGVKGIRCLSIKSVTL